MTPIDVTITALGQTMRVVGMFTPGRPAITSGPPDNWEPADPAEWDEYEITLAGGLDELSGLLSQTRPLGYPETALDYVLDLAELQWLRDRDADRWAA